MTLGKKVYDYMGWGEKEEDNMYPVPESTAAGLRGAQNTHRKDLL